MAVTKENVQSLYIAYYGRPADPSGLDYWTNRANAEGLNAVVNAFGNSEEATNLYGSLSIQARVNNLYQNMFGRDADTEGLNFYVGKVLDGTYTLATLAQHILNGVNPNVPASKADGDVLAKKLAAATAFTLALDTTAEILKYDEASEVTQGVAFLAGITAATTDAEITSKVGTATAGLVGSDAVAKTFTLTQGVDTPAGTGGNDTFVAADHNKVTTSANEVFGLGDDIKGGAGTDSLTVLGDGALGTIQLAKFSSVEKANLTSDTAANTNSDLTAVVAGGLEQAWVDAGGGITVQNLKKAVVAGVKGAALTGDTGVLFQYTDAANGVTTDAATLVLEGATGNLATVARNVQNADINVLTVKASGVSNVNLTDNGGNDLRTLNVEATGKTTIAVASSNLSKVDAAASTASVIVDATARAGALTFTGGSGDDRIDVSNAAFITTTSAFAGGNGTDIVALNNSFDTATAAQLTAVNKLSGVEQFTVKGGGNTATINAGLVTSVSKFGFENAGAIALTNVTNGNSFVVNGVVNAAGTNVAMKTGQTVLNLDINSAAGGAGLSNVTLADVQTIQLKSVKSGENHGDNVLTTVNNGATTNFTINVSGDQNLTLGASATTAAAAGFDGFTNKLNIDAGSLTGKLNVTGSDLADVIKGGSAVDAIRGGLGADELTGNGGNDVFVTTFGAAGTAGTAQQQKFTMSAVTGTNNITVGGVNVALTNGDTAAVAAQKIVGAKALVIAGNANIADLTRDGDSVVVTYTVPSGGANNVVVSDPNGILTTTNAAVTEQQLIQGLAATTADINGVVVIGGQNFNITAGQTIIQAINAGGNAAAKTAANIDTAVADGANIRVTFTAAATNAAALTVTNADGAINLGGRTNEVQTLTFGDLTTANGDINVTIATVGGPTTVLVDLDDGDAAAQVGGKVAAKLASAGIAGLTVGNDGAGVVTLTYDAAVFGNPAEATVTNAGMAPVWVTAPAAATKTPGTNPAPTVTDNARPFVAPTVTVNAETIYVAPVGGTNSESITTAFDTITDFVKGADKLDLLDAAGGAIAAPAKAWFAGDVTASAGANNVAGALNLALSDVNGATQTGTVAFNSVAAGYNAGNADVAVLFQYAGNTYAFVDNGNGAVGNEDILIKLTGTFGLTEGQVTVSDFFA